MSYWCIFEDSSKNGTITLTDPPPYPPIKSEDGYWDVYHKEVRSALNALAMSIVGAVPVEVHSLPYPASPQLNPSGCPSFCFGKEQCWGRGSCPRSRSCCD